MNLYIIYDELRESISQVIPAKNDKAVIHDVKLAFMKNATDEDITTLHRVVFQLDVDNYKHESYIEGIPCTCIWSSEELSKEIYENSED